MVNTARIGNAGYEILSDDGSFYGHIPGLNGVWANAKSLEACRSELEEVLEDWILIRISEHLPIPARVKKSLATNEHE